MIVGMRGDAAEGFGARPAMAFTGTSDSCWASFTPLKSNAAAYESAMMFAEGRTLFMILIGPSGWGKSHLVKAAAEAAFVKGAEGVVVSVQTFLSNPDFLSDPRPILVDNAHDVRRKPRDRQKLRWMVDRRCQLRRPTLVCLDENHCGRLVSELRALCHDTVVARISNPGAEERELLIIKAADKLGLDIHRSIAKVMARHHHGNAHSIIGALNRLSLGRGPWNTESSLPRACGLIFPLFVGSDGWDIRDVASEAVDMAFEATGGTAEDKSRTLCWLLRRVVGLPEIRVAEYMRLEPGAIYRLTTQAEGTGFEMAPAGGQAARRHFLNLLLA